MKSMQAVLCGALIMAAGVASARQDALPDYAFEMVAEVTMATTADGKCPGITARQKKVQNHIMALYGRLAKDGIDINDAVQFLGTRPALDELARREQALRARHGVAAKGDAALCKAIRAEAAANKALAAMLKLR